MRVKRISLVITSLVLAFGFMSVLGRFVFSAQAAAAPPELKTVQEFEPEALQAFGPAAPGSTGASAEVCDVNMLAYWKLEEANPAGTSTVENYYADTAGGDHNAGGCLPGADCPSRTDGVIGFGKAFSKDAGTGIRVVSNVDDFDFTTNQDFTAEAWVKAGSCSPRSEVAVGRSSNNDVNTSSWWLGCKYADAGGTAYFELLLRPYHLAPFEFVGVGLFGPAIANDGEFHHLVGVWDADGAGGSGTAYLYVDGVLADSESYTFAGSFNFDNPVTLGWYQGEIISDTQVTYRLNGVLDEVGIYKKALSLEEAQEHFQGGANGAPLPYCSGGPSQLFLPAVYSGR